MKKLARLFLAATLTLSMALGTTALAATKEDEAPATDGKIIASYIMAWQDWDVDDIRGDMLTHLYIAFARIDNQFRISDKEERLAIENDTSLKFPDLVSATLITQESWDKLDALREKYPHLKLIIAVGGWAADGFSEMAATSTTREIFVDSVVDYVDKHNLDGVDIDWEFPVTGGWDVIANRPEDKENYTELMMLLREKLGDDMELSFCASASGAFATDWVEITKMTEIVNTVNLMAYDMQGAWHSNTDHHTNLFQNPDNPFANWGMSSAEAVERLIAAGVPSEKILLGMATYGREFNGVVSDENNGLFQDFDHDSPTIWRGGIVPFEALNNYYINKNGFERYWDEAAKAPYLYSASENIFISYDDEESVAEKINYVKESNLAGVMYWEYTSDLSAILLNAMYQAMID